MKKVFEKTRVRRGKLVCPFCQKEEAPSWKKGEVLAGFISDRGRIFSRAKSGVCASHQRSLSREIKRARFLALLPFVAKVD